MRSHRRSSSACSDTSRRHFSRGQTPLWQSVLNWFSPEPPALSRRSGGGRTLLRFETLEPRTVLATDIAFNAGTGVLTLTVGELAATETVNLSVTGTNLNVQSNQGVNANAAAELLGFTDVAGGGTSTGSLSTVTQIAIVGDGVLAETINVNGGTFTALTVAGTINNVNFTAPSVFSNVGLLGTADLNVTAGSSLTQSAGATISTAGGGDISLTLNSGSIDVNAAVTASANGNVGITANSNVNLDAAVSASGTGNVTIVASPAGIGNFTSSAGGTISATAGDIEITAQDLITVGGAISATAGGDISFTSNFDDIDLNAAVTASGGNGIIAVSAEESVLVDAALSVAGTGTVTLEADNNASGNGAVVTTATVTTAGGDVTITAQDIDLGAAVNVGVAAGSDVELRSSLANAAINLGTDAGFGLTDADLEAITAATIRVGTAAAGNVSVTSAIALAGTATLSLLTGGGVTQNAGATLAVNSLAIDADASVILNLANNVAANLAIATTDVGADIEFSDTTGFNIDTVDGVVGISTEATGNVSLSAGGAVTQAALAGVVSAALELSGSGSFALNSNVNSVSTLAADVDGGLSYRNAGALNIGATGGTSGIATVNSNVSVSTVNGNLTVLNANASAAADIDAGTGAVSLTAGAGVGTDTTLNINANAGVEATGGVTLVGDDVTISAAVDAGAVATVEVSPFEAGTAIDVGDSVAANAAATLELTLAEIDLITAGVLVIGDGLAGNVSITAAIAAAGTSELELVSGGAIIDANAAAGADITEDRLALSASTGIAVGASLETSVANLEAKTATGGIAIDNISGATLTIGGVSASLDGVDVTTSGNISLTNNASINLNLAGENVQGTADIDLTAGAGVVGAFNLLTGGGGDAVISTGASGNVTLSADQDLLLGDVGANLSGSVQGSGSVELNAGRHIVVEAGTNVDAGATAALTATAGLAGGVGDISVLATATAGARFSSEGGDITLTTAADGAVTLDSGAVSIDATLTGAADGDVEINTDHIVIDAGASATAGTGDVTIQQVSADTDIHLGSAADVTLELSNAELDRITATGELRIGDLDNTGDISVTGLVDFNATLVDTLSLRTAGAIIDATAGEQVDIVLGNAVIDGNLALQASAGIGNVTDLDVSVDVLAAANVDNVAVASGNINITNSGALTIGTVDGVSGAVNASAVGQLLITAADDGVAGVANSLEVAADVTAVGEIVLTASNSADAGDDLTVNAGVTVESSTNDVTLRAGDVVRLEAATATAIAFDTLTLVGGFAEIDGGGGVNLGTHLGAAGGVLAGVAVNVSGGAGADVFNINVAAAPALVALVGLAGDDTFNVTPSATTSFSIDGGDPTLPLPPGSGGDVLNVDLAGTTGVSFTPGGIGSGTFSFTNRLDVDFVGLETSGFFDFGDAVTLGQTLLVDDGARHAVGGALRLGANVDVDIDGLPSVLADGDDLLGILDDEDGVAFQTSVVAGLSSVVRVTLPAGTSGFLDAFIDFDGDGVFEANERITAAGGTAVTAGDNDISFAVPAVVVAGTQNARFRVSSAGGLGATGFAADGEVEDLKVAVTASAAGTVTLVGNRLVVNGTAGNDRIIVDLVTGGTEIRARIIVPGPDVNVRFPVGAVGSIAINGGAGNDNISVSSKIFVSAQINGEAGNDRIQGGGGNDLIRGGADNDTLRGGIGNDLLLGEAGNDKLYGQVGTDVQIGGTGIDYLSGGANENILIGGSTDHDLNDVALLAILTQWSSGLAFNARADLLFATFLNLATVNDDGSRDTLASSFFGSDWFIDFANGDKRATVRFNDRLN